MAKRHRDDEVAAAMLAAARACLPNEESTSNDPKEPTGRTVGASKVSEAAAGYTLYYWPIPGRGVFIRSLFAYTNVPWNDASVPEIMAYKDAPFSEQPVPLRAPPFIVDHMAGDATISQLPAICNYVSTKVGLMPDDLFKQSLALKVLCDCNDVLGELWLHNGAVKKGGEWVMWEQQHWDEFRQGNFVNWLRQFEALGKKFGCTANAGFILGTPRATLADLAAWSLWATMARCIPKLSNPIEEHAPTVMALCRRLEQGSVGLALLKEKDATAWGQLYCGGMIEKSIREVVAGGVDGKATSKSPRM